MVCQTIINRRGHSEEITRDDVQCRIIYVAQGEVFILIKYFSA